MSHPPPSPLRFPGEPTPRVAIIASDERVMVLTSGVGCGPAESATGATLLPGECVLVDSGDDRWPAVVRRRHPTLGALVEELPTHLHPW